MITEDKNSRPKISYEMAMRYSSNYANEIMEELRTIFKEQSEGKEVNTNLLDRRIYEASFMKHIILHYEIVN